MATRRKLNVLRLFPSLLRVDPKKLLLVSGWGLAVLLLGYGLSLARGYALHRLRADWDAIQISPQPPWLAVSIKRRALERSRVPRRFSLLEPELARRVAEAFSLEPWVRRVRGVQILRAGLIRVELDYREPVAVVQCKQRLLPVDRDGVVLPADEITASTLYPRVILRRCGRPPSAGLRWESAAVQAAARVAAFLAPHIARFQIVLIDATQYRGDDPPTGPLLLETRGGTRIIWGRPPGTGYPGELAAEQKLQRLLDYAEQFGSLEAPSGPYEIDVTRWTGMSRRLRSAELWHPVN